MSLCHSGFLGEKAAGHGGCLGTPMSPTCITCLPSGLLPSSLAPFHVQCLLFGLLRKRMAAALCHDPKEAFACPSFCPYDVTKCSKRSSRQLAALWAYMIERGYVDRKRICEPHMLGRARFHEQNLRETKI